jgi:hypothetical protein
VATVATEIEAFPDVPWQVIQQHCVRFSSPFLLFEAALRPHGKTALIQDIAYEKREAAREIDNVVKKTTICTSAVRIRAELGEGMLTTFRCEPIPTCYRSIVP